MLHAVCAVCGARETDVHDRRAIHAGHVDVPGLVVYFCSQNCFDTDEGRAAVEDMFDEEMTDRRKLYRPRSKKEAAAIRARATGARTGFARG